MFLSGEACRPARKRNPNREIGLKRQESAEAIVASVASRNREGLNGKRILSAKSED
jgi:hypothetical protein